MDSEASQFVAIIPCNWLITFSFQDNQGQVSAAMRTLAMQEMIKSGILFQGTSVPCFNNSLEDIDYFIASFKEILIELNEAIQIGVVNKLVGEEAKAVFRKVL